jgi:glycosyltransferase involved in cell wall biosynthesis/multisubunit Na+/H+ antiporter MnhC subunit
LHISDAGDEFRVFNRGSIEPGDCALVAMSVAVASIGERVELLTPREDIEDPELSIVIPTLNEQLTVTDFVHWCHEGLAEAGISGEILIADSSTDATAERALEAGARVLRVPMRGIGVAYREAILYARGRYILMGDADCTYDFRRLKPFVESFHEGYKFVMGSRWKGKIEPGAMPALHRYFGTPLTTWILNRMYSTHFTDMHCGMRGVTREDLVAMDLASDSWDYTTEMMAKAVHMGLPTTEVPVPLLKDREGRVSHHKRVGWFSPWQAAWINLRAMFVYGPDFFLLKPGLILCAIGLLLALPLSLGSIAIGPIHFSLYWMLLGTTLTIVGLQAFLLGCIAQVFFDYRERARRRWLGVFPYTRTVLTAVAIGFAGIACIVPLVVYYISHGEQLTTVASLQDRLGVLGLMLLVIGFSLFTFTLVLHAAALATRRTSQPPRARPTSADGGPAMAAIGPSANTSAGPLP